MEKDEIIDINHPIFISNTEDESNTSQDTLISLYTNWYISSINIYTKFNI